MAEMAWVLEGRLLVVAHTKASVPIAEWNACVAALAAHTGEHWQNKPPRILVFTEGGGPDAVQRKAVLDAVPQIRVARGSVVSSNTLVRGMATAFSWFTGGFKVFSPAAFQAALAWLELDAAESAFVSSAIVRVRRELGDERVRSIPRAM
jgi:hypothetical protein